MSNFVMKDRRFWLAWRSYSVLLFSLFLFFALTPWTASAESLCERLLKSLHSAHDELEASAVAPQYVNKPERVRIDKLISFLFTYAREMEPQSANPRGGYLTLTRKAERDEETIHSGGGTFDNRVLLTLPSSSEIRIWDTLSVPEREWLLFRLEKLFQNGKADPRLKDGQPETEGPWEALLERSATPGQPALPYINDSGFVPILSLNRCRMGGTIGVCRQAATAMAGLLGEIGIPQEQIKLVSGGAPSIGRHIWIEVQLQAGGEWREYDPTAGATSNPRNRLKYYDKNIENTFFFTPLPWRSIHDFRRSRTSDDN